MEQCLDKEMLAVDLLTFHDELCYSQHNHLCFKLEQVFFEELQMASELWIKGLGGKIQKWQSFYS
jgi:hypothetical protein